MPTWNQERQGYNPCHQCPDPSMAQTPAQEMDFCGWQPVGQGSAGQYSNRRGDWEQVLKTLGGPQLEEHCRYEDPTNEESLPPRPLMTQRPKPEQSYDNN